MTSARLLLAAPLLAAACATTPPGSPLEMSAAPAGPAPAAFAATGEVQAVGGAGASAAWDAWRVQGPNVSVARREDGSWVGTLRGATVNMKPQAGHLLGVGIDLHVRREGQAIAIDGYAGGATVHLNLGPAGIQGRTGRCSMEFKPAGPGAYSGEFGCPGAVRGGSIQLKGEAARLDAPVLPQLVVALLGVVPF